MISAPRHAFSLHHMATTSSTDINTMSERAYFTAIILGGSIFCRHLPFLRSLALALSPQCLQQADNDLPT